MTVGVMTGPAVVLWSVLSRSMEIWTWATGMLRITLIRQAQQVLSGACTTVDGHPVAVTAAWGGLVRVWKLDTGKRRATLTRSYGQGDGRPAALDGRGVAVTASLDKDGANVG